MQNSFWPNRARVVCHITLNCCAWFLSSMRLRDTGGSLSSCFLRSVSALMATSNPSLKFWELVSADCSLAWYTEMFAHSSSYRWLIDFPRSNSGARIKPSTLWPSTLTATISAWWEFTSVCSVWQENKNTFKIRTVTSKKIFFLLVILWSVQLNWKF